MIAIQLHDLRFNAFHGIMEEEKTLGNEFLVNCTVNFYEQEAVIHHIGDTLNYVDVYNIIKERMAQPTPLLETVVMEIGNDISMAFPDVKSIQIELRKLHPPIAGFRGSVGVSWHKEF